MAEREAATTLQQLQTLPTSSLSTAPQLLSRAKLSLLRLNVLVPTADTPAAHLQLARDVLEAGALLSIRLKDPDAFTRYFQQLQPFYSLPAERWTSSASARATRSATSPRGGNQGKVTGLYLLLLLSQGDYAGFHTEIERLETAGELGVDDEFIAYPIRLEQALMEGSYDRVWGETKSNKVASDEFGVFSEASPPLPGIATRIIISDMAQVLVNTIRAEIASCSERAYPSLPISNAKNLLFLDSEGAVVDFARSRGWTAKEGRIYFPSVDGADETLEGGGKDVMAVTGAVIENTLGYARKLETIV